MGIARSDKHSHFCTRAVLTVEHAYFIIAQEHLFQLRIKLLQCFPERLVERVDWAISGRGGDFLLVANPHLDDCLGNRLGVV